jgi:uncharacterized protein YecT (DUF1311 family)
MNDCFYRQAQEDQRLLDSLVSDLGRALDRPAMSRLQEAQKTWLTYRSEHCAWEASFFEGGSIRPTILSTCMSSVTWNRIDELKVKLCEASGMTGQCEASKRYDRRR